MRWALLLLLVPAIASADSSVTVMLSPEGQALAQQLGISEADLAAKVKAEVDTAYDTSNIPKFLQQFGDATSFAQRGIGVDYMSVPKSFMIGVGAQVGVASDTDIDLKNRPTSGGLAANFSVMAGLNFGAWGAPRWTLFANGFYRKGSMQQLSGSIATAGVHLQVRLIEPQSDSGVEAKILRWGGLDLTTGIEATQWKLGIESNSIDTPFNVSGTQGAADLTLTSAGKFDLASKAATVPIELTTGFRIALLVSIYGGIGFDLNAGNSTLDANLTGHMHTTDNRDIGTVTVQETGENKASPGQFRGLAGVQVNLWQLKLFTQVNVSQLPAASVGFGIRLVL